MTVLRIHHDVSDFDAWKWAFDRDPADRRGAGVQRYRVCRSADFVTIDLELPGRAEAEALLQKLQRLWAGPARALTPQPQAWVLDEVEARAL